MLDAQFIGAIQVLVYAGAIMVVFLFVIMLLNLGHPLELRGRARHWVEARGGARRPRASRRDHRRSTRAQAARAARRRAEGFIAQQIAEAQRRRRDRRAAVQRVPAGVRADERAAARRDRRRRRAGQAGGPPMLAESLALSAALFMIGVVGVLTRRNAIIIFMCVELMLNAVNLTFVAFAQAVRRRRAGLRLLRHDGGRRRSGGRTRDHHRDLPPSADGQSPEHQPAQGLMLLQARRTAARRRTRCRAPPPTGCGCSRSCRCSAS